MGQDQILDIFDKNPEAPFFTIDDFCQITDLSRRTLYKNLEPMIKHKEIRAEVIKEDKKSPKHIFYR